MGSSACAVCMLGNEDSHAMISMLCVLVYAVEEKQEDSVHASCWASPAGPAKYDYPSINNRELINAKKIFSHGDKATLEKYAG